MTKTISKPKQLANFKSLLRGLKVHVDRAVKLNHTGNPTINVLIKLGEAGEDILAIEIARLESEV